MTAARKPPHRHVLKLRRTLQGTGFALLHDGQQVAVAHQCMGGKAWSVRVSGGRFPMTQGRRFLSGRQYDAMTYVDGALAALTLARSCLGAQARPQPLDAMWRTGLR